MKMIECKNLVRVYKTKETEVMALSGLDMTIEEGELCAIIGKSGSGKSTLLNIIAGLDRPTGGQVTVADLDLLSFSDKALENYNRNTIGFVWQNNARNLIPYLSALENVEVPMMITGRKKRRERAKYLLDLVGLSHRYHNHLGELSGGEQQRVAIAIALANEPKLLLADEPTGSVDERTTYQILEVFRKLNKELGITMVLVTHDPLVAKEVNRVITIHDGTIAGEAIATTHYSDVLGSLEDFTQQKEHEQFGVIDAKGRIHIPDHFLDKLGLGDHPKVRIAIEDDQLVITKP